MDKESMFGIAIQDSVSAEFRDEICRLNDDGTDLREEEELSEEQIESLCQRILSMPEEAKKLMFGSYCFRMQPDTIEKVFQIDFPLGKLRYYKNMLAVVMDIHEGHRICEDSFKKASLLALDQYVKQEEYDASVTKQTNTAIINKRKWSHLAKWAVAACAMIVVGISASITSNAEIRKRIIEWYTKHFSTHSVIQTSEEKEITLETIKRFRLGYIPERYHLVAITELSFEINYLYQDDAQNNLDIMFQLPGTESLVDSEDLIIEEIEWNGQQGVFMTDETGYGSFAFSVNGVPIYVSGNLSREEFLAIANGIE